MDFHKLYQTINDELFTDITLILSDANNEITIDLHKNILYSSCIYFEKLLTNFKEKHLDQIRIEVPNAFVCYDVIMSFYGQKTNIGNLPDWLHQLESVKCHDFLGLKSDILLENPEIPEKGFESLLSVVDLIGYNATSTKLVVKNLPKEYDLSKLSKELIKKILEFNNDRIVSASEHGIKIWNAETGERINTLKDHTDRIWSVSCSSDHKRIVSGSDDNSIKIWNAENSELIKTLNGHTDRVFSVCFSSDNKRIASGSGDDSIKIWDADTGELINTLNGHTNSVRTVCFSSDLVAEAQVLNNKRIISGSDDNSIKIWNAENGELIKTLNGHTDWVFSVCFSSDNKRIVSGSYDKSIKIWNTDTGELINTLNGHTNSVFSVCLSSDNKRIISGSYDKSIKIWNAGTGELINTLNDHTKAIFSVCFSSDNKRIVSGSYDNSIKIWNSVSGELIKTINGHSDSVYSVCFLPIHNDLMKKLNLLIS